MYTEPIIEFDVSFDEENAEKYYDIAKRSKDYSASIIYELAALECGYSIADNKIIPNCMVIGFPSCILNVIYNFLTKYEEKSKRGYIPLILGRHEKKNKNYVKAIKYFKKGVKQGNHYAMNDLGLIYMDMDMDGYNLNKAILYFIIAIEAGNITANFNLGFAYFKTSSYDLSIKYFNLFLEEASSSKEKETNDINKGNAYNGLGLAHYYATTDKDTSIKYFKKGVEYRNASSMFSLGMIYSKDNKELALKYFKMAAKHGCEQSALNAGEYLKKIGYYVKSIKYYYMGSKNETCKHYIKKYDPTGDIVYLIEKKRKLKIIKEEEERKNAELLLDEN